MKFLVLIVCIIPILNFSQDKSKIGNFINETYGKDFYFLESKPRTILPDELDEDWEEVLSKEDKTIYKMALEKQLISPISWQDFSLKKAILCEGGKPIVSEKNIPLDCIIFIPENMDKNKKEELLNSTGANHFIIFYKGKGLDEKKKKKEYYEFLKNFDKNKEYSSISLSQPVFFGNNYSLIKTSSKYHLETCLFNLNQKDWKKVDCKRTNY